MSIFEIEHDEAKTAHESFYGGDFEVMPMQRITYYHFFPITLYLWVMEFMGALAPKMPKRPTLGFPAAPKMTKR